jgi:hypothetical protein
VIASDLTIGGFSGKRSGAPLRKKRNMLARESVYFNRDGRLAEPTRVYRFG